MKGNFWKSVIFNEISSEFLLDVLVEGHIILQKITPSSSRQALDFRMDVITRLVLFLRTFASQCAPPFLRNSLQEIQLEVLQSLLVESLFEFIAGYSNVYRYEELVTWLNIYEKFPPGKGKVEEMKGKLLDRYVLAVISCAGSYEEKMTRLKDSLRELPFTLTGVLTYIHTHEIISDFVEQEKGPEVARAYLEDVCVFYPHLSPWPTIADLR